jgi:hypothetical protein
MWARLVFDKQAVSPNTSGPFDLYYHGRNGKMLDIDDNKEEVIKK